MNHTHAHADACTGVEYMKDRDFFNMMAHDWDAHNTSSTPEKILTILERAGVRAGMDVLDIGTGTGVLLPWLADAVGASGSVTAVDVAENMLAEARRKFASLSPAPQFLLADVEKVALSGRFDRIMLYCVFPHIHHPGPTLCRLVAENLKPGGKIVIAHPSGRAFINDVHHRRPIRSEGLPAAVELRSRLATEGLQAEIIEDSDDLYLVLISA